MSSSYLEGNSFLIRRKVLTIFGAKFHVFDSNNNLIFFSKKKAFKLKEDIRIYSDEEMADERLIIKARQVVDFSASYDVVDAHEDLKVGALRRKGMKSMFRDSWEFLDEHDCVIGKLQEDSMAKALIRRFVCNIVPQKFTLTAENGEELAIFQQHFNPFVLRYQVTLLPSAKDKLDPRLILAGGILLAAIEGRQQ